MGFSLFACFCGEGGEDLERERGGGGSEGFRDCVYVCMRVCACVDAVRGEGERVRHAFVN